jgi:hypothetical protein
MDQTILIPNISRWIRIREERERRNSEERGILVRSKNRVSVYNLLPSPLSRWLITTLGSLHELIHSTPITLRLGRLCLLILFRPNLPASASPVKSLVASVTEVVKGFCR